MWYDICRIMLFIVIRELPILKFFRFTDDLLSIQKVHVNSDTCANYYSMAFVELFFIPCQTTSNKSIMKSHKCNHKNHVNDSHP